MGHSTAAMTQRFRAERAFFEGYKRALLVKSDQLFFNELWDIIEVYIPAAEKSNHPLLIATILMSMILEQRKLIASQQVQLEKLQHEASAGQQLQAAEISRLKSEIQRLDREGELRLRDLRAEVSDMLYPSDAAS